MSKTKQLIILGLYLTVTLAAQSSQNIKNLSAAEFKKAIDSGKYLLIDVRTPNEFAQGYIRGALNINLQDADFVTKIKALTTKNKALAVYCRSGRRSKAALSAIATQNVQFIELNDGVIGWQQAGYKLTTFGK